MTTMVFHAPYPVVTGGTGSSARPPRMLQAFRDLGYEVLDVVGTGAERARRLRAVRRRLDEGARIDFAYGESSTMPTVLTESHHLPTHPLVDLHLLRLLHDRGVPTGFFYRDVYWRFPAYDETVPRLVGMGTKTLYHAELLAMGRLLDRFYMPSTAMADYVPHIDRRRVRALPPGGAIVDHPLAPSPTGTVTLLYVGNISSYYRMHALIEAVGRVDGVSLILCTPEGSWDSVRHEYEGLLTDSVEVVHGRGAELEPLFARADVCALVVEPAEYRDFAAPIKLYEYLGHGKPVLASAGTLAGSTVTEAGFGWETPYGTDEVAAALTALRNDPARVDAARSAVVARRKDHTWSARARQVAEDLTGLR
jgi:glycosyltransferase involved in cell wall biosynthesis